jgi:hypothetical protein
MIILNIYFEIYSGLGKKLNLKMQNILEKTTKKGT